jgi:murein DD-endopeptidase MepM/ murein hydrolase activator NlpD
VKGSTRNGAAARGPNGVGIDLGREPPLTVGDTREGVPQRRSVSIRWLTGTVLTGFTSTILMGGALMAALDGRHQLAFPPEAGRALRASEAGGDVPVTNGSKGDRIRAAREPASDRQVIQVSTVTKQGDRDLIKLKPFAKISTSLATTITSLSDNVPAYDPAKIVAAAAGPRGGDDSAAPTTEKLGVINDEGASGDGGDDGLVAVDGGDAGGSGDGADIADASAETVTIGADQEQIYGVNVEGEVSIKVVDFPLDLAPGDEEPSFSPAEAEAVARAAIEPMVSNGIQIAAMPYVDPDRFSFDESGTDPFSALGVRIVPENVSFVTKTGSALSSDERIAAVEKKDTLEDILTQNDVAADDAKSILAAMSDLMDLSDLHVGQKVRILFSSEGEAPRPMRVSIYEEGSHQATVARRDDDTFVRADEPETSTDEFETADQPASNNDGPMPRLYQAVYETALEQKIPGPLITELIHIFSYDVDFQSRVAPGDGLEVFHSLPEDATDTEDEEILYAAITLDGATKRYYRYRSADDGVVDYFDEEGRSAKKFLIRKPMNGGVLRSNFGYRKHPILGYQRLHPGVDWAAPRGTPILAAGNGTVEKAGWSSGYGNFTLIRHTNGYESAYAHQSAIAKGVRPGAKVRQGQLIGYVGSTGLSTGPHLHYEVRINNKPVDPLRVRLPRGRVLQGDMLTAFKQEKARIDTLIGTPASSKVAAVATEDEATN